MKKNRKKILLLVILIPVCIVGIAQDGKSQDLINSSVFVFSRPKSASNEGSGSAAKGSAGKNYKISKQLAQRKQKSAPAPSKSANSGNVPKTAVAKVNVDANQKLGVTLWRLRPERATDTGARMLTMKSSSNEISKLVAERVGLDTVFQPGDKVRLSFESPKTGYLYIIDRELHKDNTLGEPYLIFPTLKTNGGDNRVSAGKVIEIPSQTDSQFYFDITPTEKNYAGELLTAIISPTKIEGLTITDAPIKLTTAQVEKWENQWERTSTAFELEAGKDVAYTEAEKAAGAGTRQLTQTSPAPQTLISIDAPQGKVVLVSFPMKVAK